MKFIAKDKNISSPVRLGHEGETSNMVCPGRCNPAIGTPLKTQRGYRGVGKVSGQHDPPGRGSNNNMILDWAYVDESFMEYLLILIQIDRKASKSGADDGKNEQQTCPNVMQSR